MESDLVKIAAVLGIGNLLMGKEGGIGSLFGKLFARKGGSKIGISDGMVSRLLGDREAYQGLNTARKNMGNINIPIEKIISPASPVKKPIGRLRSLGRSIRKHPGMWIGAGGLGLGGWSMLNSVNQRMAQEPGYNSEVLI
jgi:hypothetical protein